MPQCAAIESSVAHAPVSARTSMMSTIASIGVIGTGDLGVCFVDRFRSRGYDVWAFDVDDRALDRAVAAGARPASGPAAVAAQCSLVVTCVPGPDEVHDCVLGPGGLAAESGSGHLLIDTTTSLPGTTRLIEERMRERGIRIVDAPVSRGVPAAQRGELSVMLGGASEDVSRARPILDVLATDIVHVGPLGAGHVVKLVNMMLMGVHLVALSRTIGDAARSGLAPHDVVQQLSGSPSASYMTEVHLPRYVIGGSYDSGFRLELMAKDLRLARRMVEESGLELPNLATVCDIYDRACATLPAMVDNMLVVPFVSGLAAGMTENEAAAAACDRRLPMLAVPQAGQPLDTLQQLDAQVTATNRAAAREAAAMLASAGVDHDTAFSVIDLSSGSSYWTSRRCGNPEGGPEADPA